MMSVSSILRAGMTVGGTQGSGVRATGPLGPAREAPPEAAGEAWLLLQELFVSRRPVLIAIAAELGLSPPGALALRHLDPDRPATMGELAQQLCYDNSNVTGIVDRLERLGYVERRANPLDRRVKLVHVTRA